MAHGISTVSGKAEVFTAGQVAWHGLGINVPEKVASDEAIKIAGLDWVVESRPLFMGDGTEIPDRVANVRYDAEGHPFYLGTVGTNYRIVQNADAFKALDEIVGKKMAIYETAGAIRSGRRVWILAKLPEDLIIKAPGGVDRVKEYLLFCNGHDGSFACRMFFTPIRVVCNNTLSWALGRVSDTEGVTFRHTGSLEEKIEDAVRVLSIANEKYQQLGVMFNHFVKIKFTEKDAKGYFEQVMPDDPEKTERGNKNIAERRDSMMQGFVGGRGHKLAGKTLWGAYNAVTEWADHTKFAGKKQRNESSRFESVIWGSSRQLKQKAFALAEEMVEAK